MEDRKMGFFKQLSFAIARPDLYGRLTRVTTGRLVGFVILFSIIYITTWFGSMYSTLFSDRDGITAAFEEVIPDFYLENGKLYLDEKFSVNENGTFICADAEIEQYDLNDLQYIMDQGNYTQVMLVSKTNLVMLDDSGKITQFKFSDFNLTGKTTRDDLVNRLLDLLKKLFLPLVLVLSPFCIIIMFVMGFVFRILAGIISFMFGKCLSGGQLYRIGVYSCSVLMVWGLIFDVFLTGLVPESIKTVVNLVLLFVYLVVGVFSTHSYNFVGGKEYNKAIQNMYAQNFEQNSDNYAPTSFGMPTYQSNTSFNNMNGMEQPNQNNFYGMGGGSTSANTYGMDGGNTSGVNNSNINAGYTNMDSGYQNPSATDNTGYTSTTSATDNTGYAPAASPAVEHVLINGILCMKIELDLVDNYLTVGLREKAIDTLCDMLKCTRDQAEDVIINWNMYYKH